MYCISGATVLGGNGQPGTVSLANSNKTVSSVVSAPSTITTPYTYVLPSSGGDVGGVVLTDGTGSTYIQSRVPHIWCIRYQPNSGTGQTTDLPSRWHTIVTSASEGYYIESTAKDADLVSIVDSGFIIKGGTYHIAMEAVVSKSEIYPQLRLYNTVTGDSSWGCSGSFLTREPADNSSQGTLFVMDIITVPTAEAHYFQAQIKALNGAEFGKATAFPSDNIFVTMKITKLD